MTTRAWNERERLIQNLGGESRTKQAYKDECDFNKIIARYRRTGEITHINKQQPLFVDISEAGDLQHMLDVVEQAGEEFLKLPADVRDAADNDPVVFLSMMETEEGQAILEEAGGIIDDGS